MNREWIEPRNWPALGADELHVWLAHTPSARESVEQFASALSSEEEVRASRFRFPNHREQWRTTRILLRLLLGRYLETPAREIAFQRGPHGKPYLKNPSQPDFQFNTSHSGDYSVFAFTRRAEVGVDIEHIRNDLKRRDDIARKYFARGEQEHLQATPESERDRVFVECWTRKEAFVKARGDGLFSGLSEFEVSLTGPRVLSIGGDSAAAHDWWLNALPDIPGYAGAVVLNAPLCAPKFWKWKSLE
jgi:4'-phosphopantetheinyl transferase